MCDSLWAKGVLAASIVAGLAPAARTDAIAIEVELIADAVPSEVMFLTAPVGDPNHFYTGGRKTMDIWVHDRQTGDRIGTFLNLPNATEAAQDGLLSMAFHPDYANNGLFYTYTHRNTESKVRITEYRRSAGDPLVADDDTVYSRPILEIDNSNSHNGGWLGFSPIDGHLYLTTGDGGVNQGPNNGLPAQDPFDLKGKLLRVDVSGDDFPTDPTRNYAIPTDNPFSDGVAGTPEVFALGLRHPFRAGFDRQTGDLYIGDVGGIQFEEINYLAAGTSGGQNYGWRALEGTEKTLGNDDPIPADAIAPLFDYPRDLGASVIGGHVYRGQDFPEFQGRYFYGDFVRNEIGSFENVGGVATNLIESSPSLPQGGRVVAFGEDGLGELYVVDIGRGEISRLVVAPILAGDYNDDGVVNGGDYQVWRDHFGQPAGTLPNDPNATPIGVDQYNTWRESFGASGLSTLQSVPEPGTLVAVLASALLHPTPFRATLVRPVWARRRFPA